MVMPCRLLPTLALLLLLISSTQLPLIKAFSVTLGTNSHTARIAESCTTTLFSTTTNGADSPSCKPLFTQVISDVDDTLKSSGGVNVAGVNLGGIDVQYKRGDFYPGVAEFMLQVSLGGCDDSVVDKAAAVKAAVPPKVAILTARAEEFKMALELKEDSKLAVAFRSAGEASGVTGWGLGPVLYGSVAEWIVQDRKGLRKFSNFERLLQQDPTGTIFQYVYVGDTGELDQEAGETMLREYPEVVKAVFLHVVSDEQGGGVPVPPPKFINGRPLIFFRTYVGAAIAAVQSGFMTLDGLERVSEAACDKLEDVERTSDKWIDLQQDLDRAAVLLVPPSLQKL